MGSDARYPMPDAHPSYASPHGYHQHHGPVVAPVEPRYQSAQSALHAGPPSGRSTYAQAPSGGFTVSQPMQQRPESANQATGAAQQYPQIDMTASSRTQLAPVATPQYPAVHRAAHSGHFGQQDACSAGMLLEFAQPVHEAAPHAHAAAAQSPPPYGEASASMHSLHQPTAGVYPLPTQHAYGHAADASTRLLAPASSHGRSTAMYPTSTSSSSSHGLGAYVPPPRGPLSVAHSDSLASDRTQAGSAYGAPSCSFYPDPHTAHAAPPGQPQQPPRPHPPRERTLHHSLSGPPPPSRHQSQSSYPENLDAITFNLQGLQFDTVSAQRITPDAAPAMAAAPLPGPVPPPAPAAQAGQQNAHGVEADGGRSKLKRVLELMAEESQAFAQEYLLVDGQESGGQALVAFARGSRNRQFAIKFFDCLEDMEDEEALYRDAVLRDVLPGLELASTNGDGRVRGPDGWRFPPFMVLERGLPLKQWCKQERNFFEVCAMLTGLAELVATLHASGRVHRDLKPDNVLLTLDTQKWRLLDLGIVAAIGAHEWPACTPGYAPPETLRALYDGAAPKRDRRIIVQPSHDVFALGLMAFEALVGHSAYPGPGDVLRCAREQQPYAWERPKDEQPVSWRKSVLREYVAGCLERDPARRPSAHDLYRELGGIGMTRTACVQLTEGKRQGGLRHQ